MERYDVIIIVVGLITTALTIGAPVIKLNTAITRLIVKLDSLGKDMTIWSYIIMSRTKDCGIITMNRTRSWQIMRRVCR